MIMGFTKPIEHSNLFTKEGDLMNPLYVGIDVSSKNNVAYLMLPNGDKHSNFPIVNSHDGSVQLVKRILSALNSHSLDTVLIGLEATSVYGDNLVYFLREDAVLAPFNRKIHILNPKQVKKFKDAYNDLPKNDYVDAFVIADCLRFGRINKEVYLGDYRYKALQNLTRARFFAVCNLVKEKQRFMNVLFKKYSTFTQEKVFSDTFSTTALECIITFVNKGAIALIAGLIGYHAARKDAPTAADHAKIILGSVLGALAYVALYMLKTFIAGQLIDGLEMTAVTAKMLSKLPGSLMNAVFAFIVAPLLHSAVKPALKHAGLYEKL